MKVFILGISLFWYGAIGSLITYIYTLLHQSIYNNHTGWLVSFYTNNTGIPIIIFILIMAAGIIICYNSITKP